MSPRAGREPGAPAGRQPKRCPAAPCRHCWQLQVLMQACRSPEANRQRCGAGKLPHHRPRCQVVMHGGGHRRTPVHTGRCTEQTSGPKLPSQSECPMLWPSLRSRPRNALADMRAPRLYHCSHLQAGRRARHHRLPARSALHCPRPAQRARCGHLPARARHLH